jgi:signal peptidase I
MTRGRADRAIEAAIAARVAEGPVGVVALVAAARGAAPRIHGREGAIHAVLHRLARRGTVMPVGHAADGGVLWARGDVAFEPGTAGATASDPSVVPPPQATANESRIATALARGVRDPLDRGRIVADVLAHLRALRVGGNLTLASLEAFGSLATAKGLLARVDRGRSPICVPADAGERVRRFVAHEGPSIAVTLAALVLVKLFVAEPRNVPSHSMEPTLKPGDRVIVSKIGGKKEPDRWAVVVFERPRDGQVLVKRAVGLGGERIQIDAFGDVIANGRRLVKPDRVNEAVRERLPVPSPEEPAGARDWTEAPGRPGVRRYAQPLWADEPIYTDDQGRPEPVGGTAGRPALHDLYVEATVLVPAAGLAGVEVTWKPRDRDGPTAEPTTVAVVVTAGAPYAAGSSVPVAISLVDGVLRTRRGRERTLQEGVTPRGAAELAAIGDVRGLAVHRDIHWTLPPGTDPVLSVNDRGVVVPEWHVFFLGDHSTNSRDSRYPSELGPVPLDHLIGPVVFRVWPPSRIGPVH